MGGRLLPDRGLPAAQFMYEDGTGRRLTLYMRKETGLNNTAFQFAERDGFGAFYWVDRPLAYAIAGRLGREELTSIRQRGVQPSWSSASAWRCVQRRSAARRISTRVTAFSRPTHAG